MRLAGFFRLISSNLALTLPFFLVSLSLAHEFHDEGKTPQSRPALSGASVQTPRFTLYFPSNPKENGIPLEQLTSTTLSVLDDAYEELSQLLHFRPEQKVVFRFLTPEEFRKHTGAPAWTSAMYLRGEVSIPVSKEKRTSPTELRRAIRHEYTHAVLSELSNRKCPAWLDEGVAQILEGDLNPLLAPALKRWVESNREAMPLSWLRDGFMGLNEKIVPAAYAQSLFASQILVNKWGYPAVVSYLKLLAKGVNEERSFKLAFGITERQFERHLSSEMNRWIDSGTPPLKLLLQRSAG
jgi:hypothetical protein